MREGLTATDQQFGAAAHSFQEVLPIHEVIAHYGPGAAIQLVPAANQEPAAEFALAREAAGNAAEWCGPVRMDNKGPYVIVVFSVGREGGAGPLGAILSKMRVADVVRPMLSSMPTHYRAVVRDFAGTPVVAFPEDATEVVHETSGTVTLLGRPWSLTLQTARSPRDEAILMWMLVGGLSLTVLMPAVVAQGLVSRWRKMRVAEQQVEEMAHLAEASGALNAQLGSGNDLLGPVLEAALRLTRMPSGTVALLEEDGTTIRIVADHSMDPPALGLRFGPDSAVAITRCIQTGELFSSEDTLLETAPLSRSVLERFHVRSMIVIPLTVEDRRLGAMVLCDSVPRRFGERELHLARLWGAQASAMLANQKMWRQTADALAGQKKLLEQREMLYSIHQRLYDPERLEWSLQELADLAPASFEVDEIGISFLDETQASMTVIACTRASSSESVVGVQHPATGGFVGTAMETRRIMVAEDAAAEPLMNPAYREKLRIGSAIVVPLIASDGQALGAMGLIRHRAGAFSQDQVAMAGLFGGRVAQAIQLTRLLRQTQRDAETRATLLHELNHRVNNNLAAIIGLLSLNQPPLPLEAEQWLERAISRIATMARTQLMFQGGQRRAPISQIVEQVLSSLSVARQPGVSIHTDLAAVEVELETDEAVPLAMVLHELCLNALKYGIGERGVLTIRGSIVQDSVIEIEVIDDGSALDSGKGQIEPVADRRSHAARVSGGGAGLQLVRELVRRELKGEFLMERIDGGGTKAIVRFRDGCVRREISSPRAV